MADNSNKDMKALQDAIKQLTGVVTQQITLSKSSNNSRDRGTRANQNVFQAAQTQAEQMGKWGIVFDAGAITIGAAMDTLGAAFGSANELQKRNLAIGGTLAGTMSAQSATVDQLSGGMVGYTNALEIATSKQEAGLNNSSAAMNKMIAGAKATGQNEKALIASMQQLERSGEYSAEQQDHLANRLNSLGQSFGISSEQMVGALNKTAGKLIGLANVIGGGAKTQEAVAVAMAALGPGGADMAGQLLQSLSDGGSMIKAQLLGVTNERRALMQGEASAGIDMLIKSGEQSQKILDKFSQGTDKAFGAAMATQIYGKDVLLASQALNKFNAEAQKWADKQGSTFSTQKALQEAYQANLLKEKEANEAFKASWESFKDRVISPLQRWATGAATKIFALLENDLWVKVAQGIGIAIAIFATAVTAFTTAVAMQKGGSIIKKGVGSIGKTSIGKGMGKVFKPMTSMLGGIKTAIFGLGKILLAPLLAIASPILVIAGIIIAVVAVIVGILAMTGKLGKAMNGLKKGWKIIKLVLSAIGSVFKKAWAGIMDFLQPVLTAIGKAIDWIFDGIATLVRFIAGMLKAMEDVPFIGGALKELGEGIEGIMDGTDETAKNTQKEVEDVKFTSMGFADLLSKEMSIRSTNLIGEQTGTSRLAAQSEGDAHQSSNQGDTKLQEGVAELVEHAKEGNDNTLETAAAAKATAEKVQGQRVITPNDYRLGMRVKR